LVFTREKVNKCKPERIYTTGWLAGTDSQ